MNNGTLTPISSSAITFGEWIIIGLTVVGLAIMVWPFLIGYINRPKLKPYAIPVVHKQVDSERQFTLLLGITNEGKNTARKCYATFESQFSAYSALKGKFTEFGNLNCVLPDGTEIHEVDIPYKRQQPLLLTRLTLRSSEGQYSLYGGDSQLLDTAFPVQSQDKMGVSKSH